MILSAASIIWGVWVQVKTKGEQFAADDSD
jgi:hypothetical protein